MSSITSYKTTAFKESQKFLVIDPSTQSPSLVLGSDLVSYITPMLNYVRADSTRLSAENTDYDVGTLVQTSGATSPGDNFAATYLVVEGGSGDFPMLNGNDLLVIKGDEFLREQLAQDVSTGNGANLVNGATIFVGSVAELEALPFADGKSVYLTDAEKAGEFVFDSSDLSSQVSTDTPQGKYIAPSSAPTGASGAWVRRFKGKARSEWYGINGSSTDSDYLQIAVDSNAASGIVINVADYLPTKTVSISEKIEVKFEGFRDYTGDNVTFPLFTLGQNADGTLPGDSVSGIKLEGFSSFGDKLTGSRFLFFRRAVDVILEDCTAWGFEYAITGDGAIGSYESLACVFRNLDLRFNKVGFYDPTGAFQASYFYGGRIEANDEEGCIITSINTGMYGTVVEGNARVTDNSHEILLGGGGSFTFSGYSELLEDNAASAFIGVQAGCTKRIFVLAGSDIYGSNAINSRAVVDAGDMNTGCVVVEDCNLDGLDNIVIRNTGVTVGNFFVKTANWDEVGSLSNDIGVCPEFRFDRVNGFFTSRVNTESVRPTQDYRLGINTKVFERPWYIGLGAGAAGTDWTTIAAIGNFKVSIPALIEITLVGRQGSGTQRTAKLFATVDDANVVTDVVVQFSNGFSPAPSVRVDSGNLQVSAMSSSTDWAAFTKSYQYGFTL